MIRRDLMNCSKDDLENFTDDEIDYAVAQHINWIQSAVYDMVDENYNDRRYGAKRDAAADNAYNDPDVLRSLIGGYMPISKSFGTFRVLYSFWKQGHKAMKQAAESISNDWCFD